MGRGQSRINVSLDPEYAEKLAILAERAHLHAGTLARSLLSQAIDEADIDARSVVEILDGIPGALKISFISFSTSLLFVIPTRAQAWK